MRIVDLSFPIKPHLRWKVAFEPEISKTLPREEATTYHAFFPLTNLDQIGVPRCRFGE
jgi:hypothetical protein